MKNYMNFIRILEKNDVSNIKFEDLIGRLPASVIESLKNCEQNETHHPEGSVYEHIRLVFEFAKRVYGDIDLMISGIFHDLGKISTKNYVEKDGVKKVTYHGHEEKCEEYIDKYIHLYSDLHPNIEKIKEICLNHMKAHNYNDIMTDKRKKKFRETEKYFIDIMRFALCDKKGR